MHGMQLYLGPSGYNCKQTLAIAARQGGGFQAADPVARRVCTFEQHAGAGMGEFICHRKFIVRASCSCMLTQSCRCMHAYLLRAPLAHGLPSAAFSTYMTTGAVTASWMLGHPPEWPQDTIDMLASSCSLPQMHVRRRCN